MEVKNLEKIYRIGRTEVRALDGVSLEVPEGDFISLTGPSGAGKTTLLNCLGLIDKPTGGTILIGGADVSGMSDGERAGIRLGRLGFVFQFFNLFGNMTAVENVMAPMLMAEKEYSMARKRASTLLETVGLGGRERHRPLEMSGGEQQRVAIARALANEPAILLADEPTGNLDSKTTEKIIELLKELNKNGQTIVMVTHERHIAKRTKREIRLFDGKISHYMNEED
jgi:putative ABC transport system ATP-binding protein